MSEIPSNLKYTQEHEWILINHDVGTIGITDFAQKALGDIVYIEFPEVGSKIEKGKTFGVVESIKSVSDLFSPVSGEITEINSQLRSSPEQCNQDPYGSWILKVKINNLSEINNLLNSTQYNEFCNANH